MNDGRSPFYQRLLLGAFGSFRALYSPVLFGAHAIVQNGTGAVALVRHSYYSGWAFPGGGVGRGEPAVTALLRELKEELGLVSSAPPVLFGLFTRRLGIATNVIALYRVTDAVLDFKPNFEIREMMFADPADPPKGTLAGVRRRFAELSSGAAPAQYW